MQVSDTDFQELADEIAREIVSTYNITVQDAVPLILKSIEGDFELRKSLAKATDSKTLKRTSGYKNAVSRARKAIYYHLRQYKGTSAFSGAVGALGGMPAEAMTNSPELVEDVVHAVTHAHVSTAERSNDRAAILEKIHRADPAARSIVDVGCGVFPLLLPQSMYRSLDRYLALDRDELAVEAVAAYARLLSDRWLVSRRWSLEDGWDVLRNDAPDNGFDIGLLLKIVPVVRRQSRHLLDILAKTPAKTLIVTGACMSMTKQVSIERRERASIESFAEQYGFQVADKFDLSNEFGYVLRQP